MKLLFYLREALGNKMMMVANNPYQKKSAFPDRLKKIIPHLSLVCISLALFYLGLDVLTTYRTYDIHLYFMGASFIAMGILLLTFSICLSRN